VTDYNEVNLIAGEHAIETAEFIFALGEAWSQSELDAIKNGNEELNELFPKRDPIQGFIFEINKGEASGTQKQGGLTLELFEKDGSVPWRVRLEQNLLALSCMDYPGWERVWPEAHKRLQALFSLTNSEKPILSIEYKISDVMSANLDRIPLTPKVLFKENSNFIPKNILDNTDFRWDISQGWYVEEEERRPNLVRLECKGIRRNKESIATISNTLVYRRRDNELRVKDLIAKGHDDGFLRDFFHYARQGNRDILRNVLVDQLLERMGLPVE